MESQIGRQKIRLTQRKDNDVAIIDGFDILTTQEAQNTGLQEFRQLAFATEMTRILPVSITNG